MDYTEKAREFFADDLFATEVTGVTIEEAGIDYAKCRLKLDKSKHCNANNTVMGGAIFTLADFTFAVAANVGKPITVTMTSQITFVAPARGSELIAEAECVKSGRRSCSFIITVTDDTGAVVASMSATGMRVAE